MRKGRGNRQSWWRNGWAGMMRGCRLRTDADQGPWLERLIEDVAPALAERARFL
jgi:hypothetical protein